MAARVVDLPEPVGPVTTTRPLCSMQSFLSTAGSGASNFSKSSKESTRRGVLRNTVPMPFCGFGELLGWQFASWLAAMPDTGRQIVEAGAHDGQLACDILTWLRDNRPEVLESLEYWILEPSARRRDRQMETLAEYSGRVRWFEG